MVISDPKYRPDIDGLRAIAVLIVVGFHAFPSWIKGGFIGVDIFFVISGFLISTIIFGDLQRNSFKITHFYSRRIKRIFPALLFILLVCFSFGWFALFPQEYQQLGKHIWSGAGFFSNFTLWFESGYFDNSAETKPLLHLWSLGIEEQFYIIWPLLLYIFWKKPISLVPSLLFFWLLSVLLNIKIVHSHPIAAFYSPSTRFWELISGSLLAYFLLYQQKNDKKLEQVSFANIQALLGLGFIFLSLLLINKNRAFPGLWGLLPNLGALLIISAGSQTWFNRVILSHPVFVWFGLISFPLYLWHWPLLAFFRIIKGELATVAQGAIIVLLSIGLAWLTYLFIEKPIRQQKQHPKAVPILLGLMLTMAILGFYCERKEGFSRPSWKTAEKANAQFVGPLWKYAVNDACLNRYFFRESQEYGWWFCMTSKDEKPTLLLLGNSFANQLYPGLAKNSEFSKNTILSIGTCDPAEVDKSTLSKNPDQSPCSGNRSLHQQRLINNIVKQNSGSLKYVIIAGLSGNDQNYINRLKRRIDFLEKNNIKVIVFLPHLLFKRDIKSCFQRPVFGFSSTKNCEFTTDLRKKASDGSQFLVSQLLKSNPNVVFFDPNDLFCNHNKCSMVDDHGLPLYRDEVHISEYGSIKLANLFKKWASKNVPEMLS